MHKRSRQAARLTAAVLLAASLGAAGCGRTSPSAAGNPSGDGFTSQTSATGKLAVSVVDAKTQQPIAGAVVSVFDTLGRQVGEWITTGNDGVAKFETLPVGRDYLVRAKLLGKYNEGASDATLQLEVNAEATLKLALDSLSGRIGSLYGAVRDGKTKEALLGATVVLDGNTAIQTFTKAGGVFTFRSVPLGPHVVTISKDGYTPARYGNVNVNQSGLVTSIAESLELQPLRTLGVGETLIADLGHDRIVRISAGGGMLSTFKLSQPTSATRVPGTAGATFATSLGNKVAAFASGAEPTWTYGSNGLLGLGATLKGPTWVSRSIDNRRLLVTDQGHNKIFELDAGSHTPTGWSYSTGLQAPTSAVYTDSGTILIANSEASEVVEIRGGARIWGFSTGLVKPTYAHRMANGNTLITDMGSNRIVEVNDKGQEVRSITTAGGVNLNRPRMATRLPNGDTLIADTYNNRVIEIDGSDDVKLEYKDLSQPMSAERISSASFQ